MTDEIHKPQPDAPRWFRVPRTNAPATVTDRLLIFVATGAYVGFVPFIPGTAGSVVGLLLARFAAAPLWHRSSVIFLVLFALIFAEACRLADSAEKVFGHGDSPAIVLDEILGMIATMFLNPTGWAWLTAGFVLFRVFDIIKPWPAVRFDRMHGGAGVMLDDLAAGVYANIVLQVLRRVI